MSASEQRHAVPVVLTIAGSDSGGGAGIQADLKTFAALGVFGTSAITCVTAQSPDAVSGITAIAEDMVVRQIRAVCAGFPVAATKTGMLYSAAIIRSVAAMAREQRLAPLVVDPVMVATSGARLLQEDAVGVLLNELLPLATVVTPNAPEAEILWGQPIRSQADLAAAATGIGRRYGIACVAKGGHVEGADVVDALYDGTCVHEFRRPRVPAAQTHGTGCTFSAALVAHLALGRSLSEAVAAAKTFVQEALRTAVPVGRHHPLNFQWNA